MKEKLNFLQKLGLFLVAVSALTLLGTEFLASRQGENARNLYSQIRSDIAQTYEGDPGDYSDPEMPVLHREGENFVCLLDVPAFGIRLPVAGQWDSNRINRYPCRFWGSAYDNSLILGGSNWKGQLDFLDKLDLGDRLVITDMTGGEFSYEVTEILRRGHTDLETLQQIRGDLTLFARDPASTGYIVVRCAFAP